MANYNILRPVPVDSGQSVGNALMNVARLRQADTQNALLQERMGLQREELAATKAQRERDVQMKNLALSGTVAQAVEASPEDRRGEAYKHGLDVLRQYGVDISGAPAEYDPAFVRQFIPFSPHYKPPKEPEPFTLGVDQVRYDASGKPIAKGPAKVEKPEETFLPLTAEEVKAYGLPDGTVAQRSSRGKIDVLSKPEKTPDTKPFEKEEKLRKEYLSANKDFISVRDAYGRVVASAKDPSAAGDLALIFNYMKVLDPGSTVREGEFANAENAGGVPSQIRNYYNKVTTGERLPPDVRTDFVDRAGMLYNQQRRFYDATRARYETLASDYGLRPESVISDLTAGLELPSVDSGSEPKTSGGNVALPPGITVEDVQAELQRRGLVP